MLNQNFISIIWIIKLYIWIKIYYLLDVYLNKYGFLFISQLEK